MPTNTCLSGGGGTMPSPLFLFLAIPSRHINWIYVSPKLPGQFLQKCIEILRKNEKMHKILIPELSGVPNWVHVILEAFAKHSWIPGAFFLHHIHSCILKLKHTWRHVRILHIKCVEATRAGFLNSWLLFQTHTYYSNFALQIPQESLNYKLDTCDS